MISKSIKFEANRSKDTSNSEYAITIETRRQQLKQCLNQCRIKTLSLFEQVDHATFCSLAHPEFSPIGWHLGHIAYTESLWLLERSAGIPALFPEFRRLFVADGLPKPERINLPTLGEVRHYLDTVRDKVWFYLETADIDKQERLCRWLIQHESQHSETITFVLQLQRWQAIESREQESQSWAGVPPVEETGVVGSRNLEITPYLSTRVFGKNQSPQNSPSLAPNYEEMIEIPSGYSEQGNDAIDALDNERPVHQVRLETYWIDRYPVTCRQYRVFIQAGGYQNQNWWSDAGWQWLQSEKITQPLYWSNDLVWDNHPVCGISWYEAEAYAQFVGKRLPTEAEWEKVASWDPMTECNRTYPWGETAPQAHRCNHDNTIGHTTPVTAYPEGQSIYGCYDLLGNVWEWTASVFSGYEGFVTYPYAGYSKVYFDGKHQVLKGGSWATRPWALRSSFRNWYHPGVRQILAGFRCASSKAVS